MNNGGMMNNMPMMGEGDPVERLRSVASEVIAGAEAA